MSSPVRLLVGASLLAQETLTLSGEDHHYLFRVRRLRVGDPVVLFDGEGHEATAEVVEIGGQRARLRIDPAARAAPPPLGLTVLMSLLKGERMDWCLPKMVELGASRIVPVRAERSVVRLEGERAARRRDRWQAQVRAAAQQCGTATLPVLEPIANLNQALALVQACPLKLVFWEEARAVPLRSALPAGTPPARVAALVGPEGGLTETEVELAREAGFIPVGLGPRILRAETAAVAAVAILAYALGDI